MRFLPVAVEAEQIDVDLQSFVFVQYSVERKCGLGLLEFDLASAVQQYDGVVAMSFAVLVMLIYQAAMVKAKRYGLCNVFFISF